jgi:hypothetical protein
MIVSEARLVANRLNGPRSKGPLTPESKAISRQSSLKHGMTGEGIVVPEGVAEEIQRRVEALTEDMKPMSPAGILLIAQMATCSVRMETAVKQESAATAKNVRHATDEFDEERKRDADTLYEGLGDNPRNNFRKLSKFPEGIERLIDAWRDLRDDLTADPKPIWADAQLEEAAHLLGLKARHARGSRIGALSRGFWGDFGGLGAVDGGDLDEEARRAWAKAALIEKIDTEIDALEAHYQTLDFETIELDRAEAGARALFDDSKGATLARRYESEARRGFFKALKEFRLVEAESAARAESIPTLPTAPKPAGSDARMGSFREIAPLPVRERFRANPDLASDELFDVQLADGKPLVYVSPVKKPG